MTIIRVANIIEEGKTGGPQIRIANVAKALKAQVETTVVLPNENSKQFCTLLEQYAIPYKTFKLSRITKEMSVALRYLFFSWFEILQLVLYLRKEKFDLVHVSGGSWQYKGVIAGKLAGIKVVWHLNDTSIPKFIQKVFTFFSRYADAFIFASERTREYYGQLIKLEKPEFVVPAPVDTRHFDPSRKYSGDEEIIDSWSNKIVIGTIANINPIKGLETFIDAAALLNENFDNLVFVVVGASHETQKNYLESIKSKCCNLSVDNMEFLGSKSDVRPLLKRFDIYTCSSNAESSPISVWEAMSMGKPVVSTDVGDVSLYVRDAINGFIVDVGDHGALKKRISYLINDKYMRCQFGRKCRKYAIKNLDISLCAQRHLEVYTKIFSKESA